MAPKVRAKGRKKPEAKRAKAGKVGKAPKAGKKAGKAVGRPKAPKAAPASGNAWEWRRRCLRRAAPAAAKRPGRPKGAEKEAEIQEEVPAEPKAPVAEKIAEKSTPEKSALEDAAKAGAAPAPTVETPKVANSWAKGCLKEAVGILKTAKGRATSFRPPPEKDAASRGVTFKPLVQVAEFARKLMGGGGVPSDGSWVALGLGEKSRDLKEKLAPEATVRLPSRPMKRKQVCEEFGCTPLPKRIRMLKESMGVEAYKMEWTKARTEIVPLRASRVKSSNSITEADMMPSSMQQARARALKFSKETAETVKVMRAAAKAAAAAAKAKSAPAPSKAADVPGAAVVPGAAAAAAASVRHRPAAAKSFAATVMGGSNGTALMGHGAKRWKDLKAEASGRDPKPGGQARGKRAGAFCAV